MAEQFNYGGQALIEGVMMRGAGHLVAAARTPEGDIEFMEQELNSPLYNGWVSKVPFIRGLGLLWDSLGLGMQALIWSANLQVDEEEEEKIEGGAAVGTVAFSLLLAIGLFFLLPAAVADGIGSLASIDGPLIPAVLAEPALLLAGMDEQATGLASPLVNNLLEGGVRLIIVIGYISLIAMLPDVKRMFAYHGAEHKTINAYEAGAPLVPEEVAKYPLEHPRCGTGFLLVVVLISIIIGVLLGDLNILMRLVSRVLLIPVIAGIAYEYIKLLARNIDNPIARLLVYPQLAMQKLTTREPDHSMLEVAIAALERVLEQEEVHTQAEVPAAAD